MGILDDGVSIFEAAKLLNISVEEVKILEKQEILHATHINDGVKFFSVGDILSIKSPKGLSVSQEASQADSELQKESNASAALFLKVFFVSIVGFLIYVFIVVVVL